MNRELGSRKIKGFQSNNEARATGALGLAGPRNRRQWFRRDWRCRAAKIVLSQHGVARLGDFIQNFARRQHHFPQRHRVIVGGVFLRSLIVFNKIGVIDGENGCSGAIERRAEPAHLLDEAA
jgi:hypothetical protein